MLSQKGAFMFFNCIAVGCGGFLGSVLRYLVGNAIPHETFPWATLAINVVGSFALTAIAGYVLRESITDGQLSLMLRVGLCGGFTTMSTFSLEVVDLASRGALLGALGYALATVALCVGASLVGGMVARG